MKKDEKNIQKRLLQICFIKPHQTSVKKSRKMSWNIFYNFPKTWHTTLHAQPLSLIPLSSHLRCAGYPWPMGNQTERTGRMLQESYNSSIFDLQTSTPAKLVISMLSFRKYLIPYIMRQTNKSTKPTLSCRRRPAA